MGYDVGRIGVHHADVARPLLGDPPQGLGKELPGDLDPQEGSLRTPQGRVHQKRPVARADLHLHGSPVTEDLLPAPGPGQVSESYLQILRGYCNRGRHGPLLLGRRGSAAVARVRPKSPTGPECVGKGAARSLHRTTMALNAHARSLPYLLYRVEMPIFALYIVWQCEFREYVGAHGGPLTGLRPVNIAG